MKSHTTNNITTQTKITGSPIQEPCDSDHARDAKKTVFRKTSAKQKLSKADLAEVLLKMPLVCGKKPIAVFFAKKGRQKYLEKGKELLVQGAEGNSFYLILRGRVSVSVNYRTVAHRSDGDFIGETCILAPCKKRTATVIAEEDSLLLELRRSDMSEPLEKQPCLLKHIALTLSERLNERGGFFRQPNSRPVLFIGSSSERKKIVEKLAQSMALKRVAEIKPWTSAFPLSANTLDALLDVVSSVDFALLVLSPDDKVKKRNKTQMVPRDNIIFELGLFLGVLGKERTILLVEDTVDIGGLNLPSDLAGVTYLPYRKMIKEKDAVSNAIDRVVERINAKGTR